MCGPSTAAFQMFKDYPTTSMQRNYYSLPYRVNIQLLKKVNYPPKSNTKSFLQGSHHMTLQDEETSAGCFMKEAPRASHRALNAQWGP